MEEDLLKWKERLDLLEKDKRIALGEDDSAQSVYSAIRDNPEMFKKKAFSVRTSKNPPYKQFVIRIK
jgi:hypothetical protein